jgi:DNA topoisomerase-3
MLQVCEGTKSKQDMLAQSIEQYKDMYVRARGEFNKVVSVSLGSRGDYMTRH